MARTKPDMEVLWANSGSKTEPNDTKKNTGWIVEKPALEYMNWLQNRVDEFLGHMNDWGIPTWDSVTDYPDLAWTRSTVDDLIYVSNTTPNLNKEPSVSAEWDLLEDYLKTSFDLLYLPRLSGGTAGRVVQVAAGGEEVEESSVLVSSLTALSSDEEAAITGANTPSASNVFATIADLPATDKNLKIVNNGATPDSKVDITADRLTLFNASGSPVAVSAVSQTVDITLSGAGGLDTGAEAGSTWYYNWYIRKNDGTESAILSASDSAPTMPAGYTYKRLIGAVYNNSSNNFVKFEQRNKHVRYIDEVLMKNGSFTATSWTALSVTAFFPTIAELCEVHTGDCSYSGWSHRSDGKAGSYTTDGDASTTDFGGVFSNSDTRQTTLQPFYPSGGSLYYYVSTATAIATALGYTINI